MSNEQDDIQNDDPTLEDDMRKALRAMGEIFITDPDDLHDFNENIERILATLTEQKEELE